MEMKLTPNRKFWYSKSFKAYAHNVMFIGQSLAAAVRDLRITIVEDVTVIPNYYCRAMPSVHQ